MDNAAARIDEEHAGAEPVEGVRKCCRLGLSQIQHLGYEHRPAGMWRDELHATARLIVHEAIALMTKNGEHRDSRGRFFENGGCRVDPPLRICPFLLKAGLKKFAIGQKINRGDDVSDTGEKLRVSRRIEFDVFIEIKLNVMRIEAVLIEIFSGLAGDILRKKQRRATSA